MRDRAGVPSKGSRAMVVRGDPDSRGCDFVAQSVGGVSWSGAIGEELGLLLCGDDWGCDVISGLRFQSGWGPPWAASQIVR